MPHIRISARAIVFDGNNNLLLLNKYGGSQIDDGEFYVIPGGGVEDGETLKQAVVREVFEETGLDVSVGELVFVQELEPNGSTILHHSISHFFRCELTSGNKLAAKPELPDVDPISGATASPVWFPVGELTNINLLPKIGGNLQKYYESGSKQVFEPRYFVGS